MESDDSSNSEYWSDEELTDSVQELSEGMTFLNAADAVSAVRDYALRQNKSPTAKQIVKLAGFASSLRTNNAVTADDIIQQMRETNGVGLEKMKRKVYRAMEHVREQSTDEAFRSFGLIGPYLTAFAKVNPGTFVCVEKASPDDQGNAQFRRAAVVVGPSVQGAGACQRVVGVDCSHSKSKHFSGVQVHLVGRDGNFQNITIAFGLVPAEDIESYAWFLDCVEKAGYELGDIPIFCDRNNSLLSVAKTGTLQLRFCTLHIIRNVAHKFGKLSKGEKDVIWEAQAAETVEEYRSKLEVVRIVLGEEARTYLREIDPVKWCLFANLRTTPLYGWRTSNFVESVFGTQLVKGLRRLHPYEFIKKLCEKLMADFYTRAKNAAQWKAEGLAVTPGARAKFNKQAENFGYYLVMPCCNDECFVMNSRSPTRLLRRVILSKKECSCGYVDQYGIPCRHVVAALAHYDREEEAPTFFHKYYSVAAYAEAFAEAKIRIPLDQELIRDSSCLPPTVVKRAGRRKVKRIRSNGE